VANLKMPNWAENLPGQKEGRAEKKNQITFSGAQQDWPTKVRINQQKVPKGRGAVVPEC